MKRKKILEVFNFKVIRWMWKLSKQIWSHLLLFILLSIVISLCSVVFALASRNVIDTATGAGGNRLLLYDCLIMFGVVVVQLALQAFAGLVNTKATIRLEAGMKQRLFETILGKDWLHISRYHSGDLMARVTSDIGVISGGITGIVPDVVAMLAQLVAAFAVLMTFDVTFAVIALIIGPLVVFIGMLYSKKIKHLHIDCQESDAKARSFIQEALQNLLLIRTFTNEKTSAQRYEDALQENNRLQMKKNAFSILSGSGLSLGFWLGYLFALAWGSYRLSTGFITFGTMTAFLQLVGQVQSPFHSLTRTFPRIYSTFASAGRVMEIEELPGEATGGSLPGQMPEPGEINGLVLRQVSFSYDRDVILTKADLQLGRGELAIIAGPSGEGKTTLFRMLLGLLRPSSGSIHLTCQNGESLPMGAETRRYISYVPQGNFVLSGTIEENIRYGRADATMDEIVRCAKAACIYDFILEQPDQFATMVGERGMGLSEGQAQRLAIARALLRDAPVLLLDEATSALDEDTETRILEHLQAFAQDRICLFVSHRESVNKACGRVFYLKQETLTELRDAQAIQTA